jgi:hypothetical protein
MPRVDKIAYILLLVWAVPFPPFIQLPKYGVYEDAIMYAQSLPAMLLAGFLACRGAGLLEMA